eukprot:416793_1
MVETLNYGALSAGITILVMWSLTIFFEKLLHIKRNIFTIDDANASGFKGDDMILIRKLSHTIDSTGKYRMKTRSTKYWVRCVTQFGIIVYFWIVIAFQRALFMRYFVDFDRTAADHHTMHIFAGMGFAIYVWDILFIDVYIKKDWMLIIHHVNSIIWCIVMMNGVYVPFAMGYGIPMVAFDSITLFIQGFRCEYHDLYPELTRQMSSFLCISFVLQIILNMVGQAYLIIYGLFVMQAMPIYSGVLYIISMCCFIYTDFQILQTFKSYTVQKYENMNWNLLLSNDSGRMPCNISTC